VAGSVGGEQQRDQPAQRKSCQQYGGQRHDEPKTGALNAKVGANWVGEQVTVFVCGTEGSKAGQRSADSASDEQQREQDEYGAVGAVGVHQRLRVVTRTDSLGAGDSSKVSSRCWAAAVAGSRREW